MSRPASAIGAGLAPVRGARPIDLAERIHVVGVAGAGASAAALLARARGAQVSGCDPGGPSPYTPALEAADVRLDWAHDPAHVREPPQPTRLAVTKALTATKPDHPELEAAREAGIPVEPWQQTVADAAAGRRLVGVAGTHGKSTCAGWLVHVLATSGLDPSAFVGALLPPGLTGGVPATARIGEGPDFVVEADEYAGNFDAYRPEVALLTSIDWDHPDVFEDLTAVVGAFETWLRSAGEGGRQPVLVANLADAGVSAVVRRLATGWTGAFLPVALVTVDSAADLQAARRRLMEGDAAGRIAGAVAGRILAAEPEGTTLEIAGLISDDRSVVVRVRLAGRHNAANALGVAATALTLGLSGDRVAESLATFEGVGRRLERVGRAGGVTVYDDYGHHPVAIRATLEAVRQREPGRRVWAVYEPLTYHRTAALLDGFAEVLAEADGVAIAEIWAGRDPDTTVASAEGLAAAVRRLAGERTVGSPGTVEETARWLASVVREGDVVLVMGGGRSYRVGPLLLDLLGHH
jgi:UDP-N-acetylmuramate--alanine ligase